MANQARFLGSEGTRFLGQTTVDIQLNDWLIEPNAIQHPVRQRAVAVAQGITVVVPEASNVPAIPPNGPQQENWMVAPQYLNVLEFTRLGPSPPNDLNLPEVCFSPNLTLTTKRNNRGLFPSSLECTS